VCCLPDFGFGYDSLGYVLDVLMNMLMTSLEQMTSGVEHGVIEQIHA
jgi:hypothetical protein